MSHGRPDDGGHEARAASDEPGVRDVVIAIARRLRVLDRLAGRATRICARSAGIRYGVVLRVRGNREADADSGADESGSAKHPGARGRPGSRLPFTVDSGSRSSGRGRHGSDRYTRRRHRPRRRQVLLGKRDADDLPDGRLEDDALVAVAPLRLEGVRARGDGDDVRRHARGGLVIDAEEGSAGRADLDVPALGVGFLDQLVQVPGGSRAQLRGPGAASHFLEVDVRVGGPSCRELGDGEAADAVVGARDGARLDVFSRDCSKSPFPYRAFASVMRFLASARFALCAEGFVVRRSSMVAPNRLRFAEACFPQIACSCQALPVTPRAQSAAFTVLQAYRRCNLTI
jgi:hypothetical protein